ncbi:MAG: PAS domain S-box protein [Syntrophobacter sp.]
MRRKAAGECRTFRHCREEPVCGGAVRLRKTGIRPGRGIRKRGLVELALRRSEEKFRTLVENSIDMIYTVSLDGKFQSLNPAFEQITGWSAREWIGKDYSPLVHPEDIALLQARGKRILRGERLEPAEARLRTKSGEYRTVEFNSAAIPRGNSIIGLVGTARDVTGRKKVEDLLIQRNEFLNSVLESLAHPFYVINAEDYSIIMANAAASSVKISTNTKCYELFHRGYAPCGRWGHACPLEEIKKTKKPLVLEHTHYDSNGSPRYVEIHAHPILGGNGEVTGIIEYCLDITDRKLMEEDLRGARDELEDRVRQRTAELAKVNCALRTEIRVRRRAEKALRLDEIRLEALQALSQMTLASEEEIAGYVLEQQVKLTNSTLGLIGFLNEDESILDLHAWTSEHIPECGLPDVSTRYEIANHGAWADAVRQRSPVIINDPSLLKSDVKGLPCGSIPLVRLLSIPVFDGDRIIALAIVANKDEDYDQSDVRQLTLLMDGMWKLTLRERSAKALRESENLAGIGRALSGVAHDMKTPLIAIGGFARLVQTHMEETSPDRQKMEIILRETHRMEQLVGNMLDFSRPLDLVKTPEEILHLIGESLEIARPIAEKKRVELRVRQCNPVGPIPMDGIRIKQAILNLMTNAIDATQDGGSVEIHCHKKDSRLVIDIRDCGCGIPAGQRKDIFLPFFTTKKEGTGLGLPIVKKIAEAHEGYIEIFDNPEGGVTFRLTLPAL